MQSTTATVSDRTTATATRRPDPPSEMIFVSPSILTTDPLDSENEQSEGNLNSDPAAADSGGAGSDELPPEQHRVSSSSLEPSRLVLASGQQQEYTGSSLGAAFDSEVTKQVKAMAKTLDEDDRQAKVRARQDPPQRITITPHKRQAFPHEKFGRHGPVVTPPSYTHDRKPFPHEKFCHTPGHHPHPLGHSDDEDWHDINSESRCAGAVESMQEPPSESIISGDQSERDVESLIQAQLVTSTDREHGSNIGGGGNDLNVDAIPKAEVVRAEEDSICGKLNATTTGSKVFCLVVVFLLAAVACVGIVCGSGVCSAAVDQPTHSFSTTAPTISGPATEASTVLSPSDQVPTSSRPTPTPTDEPTEKPTEEPRTSSPTTAKPTTQRPTSTKPTPSPTEEPTSSSPTTAKPTTQEPTTAKPTPAPTPEQTVLAFGNSFLLSATRLDRNETFPVGTFPSNTALDLLTGTLPSELGLLTQLTYLGLYEGSLTGTIPSELGTLTALTQISLYENAFIGPIPSELALLTEVNRLSLSKNFLTGTIPTLLGEMTAMTQLTLFDNALTGPIPSELALLTEETRLSLSENDLDGSIPSELGLLSALTTLTLNENQLTSSIPSELGRLTALIYLSLSNNNLSGPLPSEMGLLTALTSLYLTNNLLTGTIPSTLCSNDDVSVTVDELEVTCPSTPKPTNQPTAPRPTARPTPVPAPQPTGPAPGITESCVNNCCETCWTNDRGTYCEIECD